MTSFKFNVNQEVLVDNGEPHLVGLKVKILARFHGQWRDGHINTNAYKVCAADINCIPPFEVYEEQLEEIDNG